ncbi:hypothetical protein M758_10G016800 [Ceratodon purpureus]|nr:hypothetical protein M758_10G016800 [Ceratodon purpureus]
MPEFDAFGDSSRGLCGGIPHHQQYQLHLLNCCMKDHPMSVLDNIGVILQPSHLSTAHRFTFKRLFIQLKGQK